MLLCCYYLTQAQKHGDIEVPPEGDPNCAANLNAPLSTQDWFDCPTSGDIMHCQRFVEIGRNLFPTNKLEVSLQNPVQIDHPRRLKLTTFDRFKLTSANRSKLTT